MNFPQREIHLRDDLPLRISPLEWPVSQQNEEFERKELSGLRENYDFPCEGKFTSSYFAP